MEKGIKITQNSLFWGKWRRDVIRGVLGMDDDAAGGEGGPAGTKKEGMAATVDCF